MATARRAICALTVALFAAFAAGCSSSDKHGSTSAGATTKRAAPSITVPALTGVRADNAKAQLRSLDLIPKVLRRYSDLDSGLVTKTRPPAGDQVQRGTRIALVVSLGPRPASQTSTSPGGSSTPTAGHCGPGQYTRPNGTCAPIPQSNGGAPPANSPEGQQQLQTNPDCRNVPPPPPGYTGPVQC